MKKNFFFFILLLLFYSFTLSAKTAPPQSAPESQTSVETVSTSSIIDESASIGKVKIESYAAPQVLAVTAIKMYRGKGNPQKYMGGWLEGKAYSIEISARAWKKTWGAMNPKFDPLGKEVIIFVKSNGQLEGMGEVKGNKIVLSCSRENVACKVDPAEIPLASLKVEKPL